VGDILAANSPLVKFLQQGNTTVLLNLVEWVVSFQETFINPGKGVDESTANVEKQRLRSVSMAAQVHLSAFVQECQSGYLERVSELLEGELVSSCDFDVLKQALSVLQKGASCVEHIAADSAAEFIAVSNKCVRQLCRFCGEKLQQGFVKKVESLVFAAGTVRVFRQKFTLEDAIGSHVCSLEALPRV
jgi:hypothetical protein